MTVSSELTVRLHTPGGDAGGSVRLPAEIFDAQANIPLMHQVVVAQLAAARAGTHDTKTRGEVAGGGHKPYRQKGTGRARQGSTRAPQFVGGGVVHGPTPRNYAQRTPKKMKAAALRGALSDRARGGLLHVVSAIVDGDTPSTKSARELIESITDSARVLVVVGRDDLVAWRSLRNLPSVHLLASDQLNTYDVLVCDDIVFTEEALRVFVARSGHELTVEQELGSDTVEQELGSDTVEQGLGSDTVEQGLGSDTVEPVEPNESVDDSEPAAGKEDAK